MTDGHAFEGFPGIGKGTAVPNLFFERVLPRLGSTASLLAFLWVARIAQEQRGQAQCAAQEEIWAWPAARESFENLAGGPDALATGLAECVELGVLLPLSLSGPGFRGDVYFVNNPASRRAIARARAGQLDIRPGSAAVPASSPSRPDIFRLYEGQIGTVTPLMADRLAEAAGEYPRDWIEAAFREAAQRNVRNWRYIERILESWSGEGQGYEATPGDSFESAGRGYPGSPWNRSS